MEIDVGEQIGERLSDRAEKNDFDSTEEYATTLIQTVLDELEREEDTDEIEGRLEDLGYL